MKKFFKFLGITFVVIIALLIAIPLIFSDEIEEYVKKEINGMVDAKVDYTDFSLSIFKSFPDVRAGLDGVSVVGKGRFDGDTLAYIGAFSADVDVMSVIKGDYKINAILLNDLIFNGIVAADSAVNWDIVIANDTVPVEEAAVDTAAQPLKLNLKKVSIKNANISFVDSTSKMAAYVNNLNLDLKGKMYGDMTDLKLKLDIEAINLLMNNLKMLRNASVDFDADIEADLANNEFSFKENTLNFSGVPLAFNGSVKLNEASTLIKMSLAASKTDFRTILALVPSYIMKDVPGLKADGTLELYAKADGEYIDMNHIPSLDVAFKINNGSIKYPDLPKSLQNINIDLTAKNPGGSADQTVVDMKKMHFELGENPFDVTLNLVKPMSNPTFKTTANGTIDLNSLKEALPLDSMTIGGILKANLSVATDMQSIEKEKYEDIEADGTLELNKFTFESKDFTKTVEVPNAKLIFSPKFLELNPLDVKLGKSDFALAGKVEQYLSYVLNDGTLKGVVTLKSDVIDCNELMNLTPSDSSQPAAAAEEAPAESGVVEIPKNIDFSFSPSITNLYYDRLTVNDITGKVATKDGVASLNNVKVNMCDGSISLNGKYNPTNVKKPAIDMLINMNNVDINKLTNSFSTIDSLLPIAQKAHGKVSIGLDIDCLLDETMSPVIKTVNGNGTFKSDNIQLSESDFQMKLSKLLNNDKYENLYLKDCSFKYKIVNGDIVVDPFNFKMLNKQTTFSGKQGLDQTMDYVMSIPVTRAEAVSLIGSKLGSKINTEGPDIPVGISIGGTLTQPKLSLNLDDAKKMVGETVKAAVEEKVNEVKEKVQEKVEEKVEEVKEKVKEEVKSKVEDKISDEIKNNEQLNDAKGKAKDALKGLFKKK